jgi:hypothetical protein
VVLEGVRDDRCSAREEASAEAWQLRLAHFTSSTFLHPSTLPGPPYPLRISRPSLSATFCAHIARGEYVDFPRIPPALTRQHDTSRFACLGILHSRSAVSRQDFHPFPNPKVRLNAVAKRPLDTPWASSWFLFVARLSGHGFLAAALFLSIPVALLATSSASILRLLLTVDMRSLPLQARFSPDLPS